MKKRLTAMLVAAMLLMGLFAFAGTAAAAQGPDKVFFNFYYQGGGRAGSLDGLIAPVTVSGTQTVMLNSSNIPIHNFGYQILSISQGSYTGTDSQQSVTVDVTVRQVYGWTGNYYGYPGYPNNGYWYSQSWYPDPYYYNNNNYYSGWYMPDATYTWNGQTYTIPGYLVYNWITGGSQVPWSGYGSQQPAQTLPAATPTPTRQAASGTKPNIYVGGTMQLTSAMLGGVDPYNRYIYFRSSDTRVATITDSGLVTGVGAGTTRLVACDSSGRQYGAWDFTVGDQAVKTITLNYAKRTLQRNSDFQLIAYSKGVPVSVNWFSSNPSIASVDADGWVTTYDRRGKVTITGYVQGGPSRKCTITVK